MGHRCHAGLQQAGRPRGRPEGSLDPFPHPVGHVPAGVRARPSAVRCRDDGRWLRPRWHALHPHPAGRASKEPRSEELTAERQSQALRA
ncbi:hypothetical protein G6F35_018484 [Rhizopus arrhizus]|nr:hypothetical protein G6F35_018484 [Rhizopus arrhizus]